ncbi:acyl-CoA synthetase [Algoriphagus marinus]|uniref:acyl-CoA synthetase n=1 Tax=Algoriphagus marinus TaxID=1925762 RepID=UPI00094BC341|nr:acyl-CoA synthetase [Algoriphagus marinus]
MLQIFKSASLFPEKIAIIDSKGSYTFSQLLSKSQTIANHLLAGKNDLNESRVAFMVSPGFEYVATQWAIWQAGGIAVPLCISYPFPSLKYVLDDTEAEYVIAGPEYLEVLAPIRDSPKIRFFELSDFNSIVEDFLHPKIDSNRGAMILYTSGTTSLPKGVLTTHANIESQISTLVEAWKWKETDHTLCLLPLHHVHGIINVVSSALWSGACVQFQYPFDAEKVFEIFEEGKVNVFMAVPTIYFKLMTAFENFPEERQKKITGILKQFRLMISGSAALPVSVMRQWEKISNHYLLERYGMTEIGMAISNPYEGERRAGYIGHALPKVEIRLVDEHEELVLPGHPGEIQVKGPSVFKEYWRKPEATQKSFTKDGWFKTGDIAVLEEGYYRILGRDSIDIIKSGGYKISALEIEEVLRTYPLISDCGVVGIPSEEWGEIVVAALVCDPALDSTQLTIWLKERMPGYKIPRKIVTISELPRNAMGKVTKNELKKLF